MIRIALVVTVLPCLAGCALWQRPALEAPPYVHALEREGVDRGTLDRIEAGRVLGYHDIVSLVEAGVPSSMIVPYLEATRTPYNFPARQINRLVAAGADDDLVNFLGRAKGIYLEDARNVPRRTASAAGLHPYWGDPDYSGPAPFGFTFPDAWYDSDYWRGAARADRRIGR